MIRFEPCQGWHIPLIEPQKVQVAEKAFYADVSDEVVRESFGWSAWAGDHCIGAAGVRPIWPGRAVAWALVGRHAGPFMAPIVKKIRFFLATWPDNRVEMTVREDFPPGCRLALVLGFEREGRLVGFFPDGSTALLYARFRQFLRD